MKTFDNSISKKMDYPTPIRISQAEPWQWNLLAKAFLNDPTLNFWLGKKTNEKVLQDFFEAVIKDTLASDGAVFCSPDQKVILIWTRHAYSKETPSEWKQRWHQVLESEGVKRYYWLYEASGLQIDEDKLDKSMLPDYIAVSPESQGVGYGSYILKWTLDHFESLGYEVPFLLASTRRSAKLYGPLLGFHFHKEILTPESSDIPAGVFMKRNVI
ncbi:GNAT family N-acetyltransferase [Dyadobacter sp. 3J3]|uniref:GNAT family N-acetyltransferase n=1 Tax=Dyadobacter sp. 3J3 TaxID=2606600 RepID=UPI00135C524A|nr:GNAT family N-acetyltransferase [Dyadobacter sp. 3J3]